MASLYDVSLKNVWCHRENGGIPNKYPLYKVYMGLMIKGTVPKNPSIFAEFSQVKVQTLTENRPKLSGVHPPCWFFIPVRRPSSEVSVWPLMKMVPAACQMFRSSGSVMWDLASHIFSYRANNIAVGVGLQLKSTYLVTLQWFSLKLFQINKRWTVDIFLGILSSHPTRGRAIISNLSPDLQSGKNEWMSLCPRSPR